MTVDRRTALLQHAEYLIRTRGYSDFSYADLAKSASISKPAVHHYFPTKEDLGVALVNEYLERFRECLSRIDAKHRKAKDKLVAHAQLFADSLNDGMLPLCGALSGEWSVLPESMRSLTSTFFQLHLQWLERIIEDGIAAGELRADRSAKRSALMLLSSLEGGSLVGWALRDNASILTGFEESLRELAV
ncbi:TetR/AcrR family transcriptional regulator [Cupriavidus necator]|uniref:TetR/AcrR family transcriptional regulator n=1 Tax=Cupriavidus necator TaxID=106590 RepID=A0A1U9UVI3_CUPNE|nr:TetR/AcrR family transcriptional regulator [Cupriavidus necator]AQV96579.1 TetR/AcrR family transcriptional regulator [Cupriavidus necator]